MDYGPLFEELSGYGDDQLSEWVETIMTQLPGQSLNSRVLILPDYINGLQGVVDTKRGRNLLKEATISELDWAISTLARLAGRDLQTIGPILDGISGFDDEGLLSRVRIMMKYLPRPLTILDGPKHLARLATLPAYIDALQGILDASGEGSAPRDTTLAEVREALRRLREFAADDLEFARRAFESMADGAEVVGYGTAYHDDRDEARDAARELAEMQASQKLRAGELEKIDRLYNLILFTRVYQSGDPDAGLY